MIQIESHGEKPCSAGKDAETGRRKSLREAECRICRCSAEELDKVATPDRLYRLECACTGSVEHLCGGCYRRYYLAQGLDTCELCSQPISIEETGWRGLRRRFCCRQAPSVACTRQHIFGRKGRFLAYACFVLTVFVVVIVLFFAASASARRQRRLRQQQEWAQKTELPTKVSQQTPSASEGTIEGTVFVAVACINFAIALAYVAYTYGESCASRRQRQHGINGLDSSNSAEDYRMTNEDEPVSV